MGPATKPPKSPLAPVPWPQVEPHYRAGIRSVLSLSKEFHVSRPAIEKHARKHGWVRDLNPAIQAKSNRIVSEATLVAFAKQRQAAYDKVAQKTSLSDKQIVDAGAEQLALVRLDHRQDITALRVIIKGLMRELTPMVDQPELYALVYDALDNPDEPAIQALRDMAAMVVSLPGRIKSAKDLADTLYRAIAMEREAFGLNAEGGNAERYLVIVRDYTGKGDPDSPRAGQAPSDEYGE